MAELKRYALDKSARAMFPGTKGVWVKHEDAQAALDELRAEVEALRADAGRYRWLRDKSACQWEYPLVCSQERTERGMLYVGPLTSAALDAAIDTARATGDGKG